VKIGQLVSGGFLIEEGLEPGEVIATAGANFLTDGQLVRPDIE
jgi:hypothetical protein